MLDLTNINVSGGDKSMVAHAGPPRISPDQYLQQEAEAETKSEFVDGIIVAELDVSRC